MSRPWIPLAWLAISTSAYAQSATPQNSPTQATPDFTDARNLVLDRMAKDSVPGLAIAVARGDSILWEEGFGWADRERRIRATAQTPFYLASLTKTITATAVMLLQAQGRLDLDRPANDYLDRSHLWSPAYDPAGATVRRLMTHTSGLTTFDLGCPLEVSECRVPPPEDIISKYGVLVWPPGVRFDYSNLGYFVLGEVVGRAAGEDLATFLRDAVFRPLHMTQSSLGVNPALERQTAVPYRLAPLGPVRRPGRAPSGASTAYASAHDLVLFGQLHAKVHRSGVRAILSDAAIDTMQHSVVPTGDPSSYGLGWWVDEDRFGYRSVLAQGGWLGASAWLRVIPSEQIVVVVLANRGVGFSDVVDAVLSAMLPRYATAREARQANAASASSPQTATRLDTALVGTWTGFVRVEKGDRLLEFTLADSGSVRGSVANRPDRIGGGARVCCGGNLIRISIPGDLETPDSSQGRRLTFYLRPHDGRLDGTLTTQPTAESGLVGRLSYWVELRKQR